MTTEPKSGTTTNTITLTPGNWLYNAGVIGFLRVLGKKPSDAYIRQVVTEDFLKAIISLSYIITTDEDIDEWWKSWINKGKEDKRKKKKQLFARIVKLLPPSNNNSDTAKRIIRLFGKLFGSQTPFQNLVQLNEYDDFLHLIRQLPHKRNYGEYICNWCNTFFDPPRNKLQERLTLFADTHAHKLKIGPSVGEMPNAFWFFLESIRICYNCTFFLLFSEPSMNLGWISLYKDTYIFINAPSFHVMWHLNNYARQMLSRTSSAREVLGLSLIEYTIQTQKQIHGWTAHNVEVVVKRRVEVEKKGKNKYEDKIEFVQLPADIVQLLNDPEVAWLLKKIGDINILNLVLDKKWDLIQKSGMELLRTGIILKGNHERFKEIRENKKRRDKLQRKLNWFLSRKEVQQNPTYYAHLIFKLYNTLIAKSKMLQP